MKGEHQPAEYWRGPTMQRRYARQRRFFTETMRDVISTRRLGFGPPVAIPHRCAFAIDSKFLDKKREHLRPPWLTFYGIAKDDAGDAMDAADSALAAANSPLGMLMVPVIYWPTTEHGANADAPHRQPAQ